jgi:hypothetical protein
MTTDPAGEAWPVPSPGEERVKLRNEMPKWQGQVKDPRWRKLLECWNKGRPGD